MSLRAGPLISVAVGILAFALFSLGTQLSFETADGVVVRLSDRRARDGHRRLDRRPLHARRLRARTRARRLLALRAGAGRRPGARAGRRRPAAPRQGAGDDGHVLRPPRVHVERRGDAGRERHHRAQLLPPRDERGHPRPRRHARLLHGRRHLRDLGRAARAGGSRRPRARRLARDAARAPAEVQRRGCASRATARATSWASGSTPGRS